MPKTSPTHTQLPLTQRKRDILYLTFFIIHIPVMLLVDLVPLYPPSLQLPFLLSIRQFYIETYKDRNFVRASGWFTAFVWMEAGYHLPLSIWAIGALMKDHPLVPLHLLVWAVQTAITTLTCVADYTTWDITAEEKWSLGQLYLPYLALALFMGVDMFGRLQNRLVGV